MQCVCHITQLQRSTGAEQHQTNQKHLSAGREHILHWIAQRFPQIEMEETLTDGCDDCTNNQWDKHRSCWNLLQ